MSHLTRQIVALLAQQLRNIALERVPKGRDRETADGAKHKGWQLHDSIKEYILSDTEAVVGSNLYYARYVHDGTGLYGPLRRKIVPKTRKALHWPGAAHPVKSVKGMRARPFLAEAAEEMARRPLPPLIRQVAGEAIARDIEAQLKRAGLEVKRG